jgi:hypothetical protein
MTCNLALYLGLLGLVFGGTAVIASLIDRRHRRRT